MKKRGNRVVSWGVSVVVLAVLTVEARGEPDLSTPDAAFKSFRAALENGDAAGLANASVGGPTQLDWVQAEGAQLRALKDLETALSNRYGASDASDKGKEIQEEIVTARDDDLHTDLGHAYLKEAQAGEVLIVLNEAAPADHQGRLVRNEGRWKVDLGSLADYMAPDDVPVMKAVAVAARNLARDIAAGKFAAIDDAADAIDKRLTPATEPVPKPEPSGVPTRRTPPGKPR